VSSAQSRANSPGLRSPHHNELTWRRLWKPWLGPSPSLPPPISLVLSRGGTFKPFFTSQPRSCASPLKTWTQHSPAQHPRENGFMVRSHDKDTAVVYCWSWLADLAPPASDPCGLFLGRGRYVASGPRSQPVFQTALLLGSSEPGRGNLERPSVS
jgi:hypothetical protein